ncbi:MAG: sugar transferase [Clostridiaceae bacterium]
MYRSFVKRGLDIILSVIAIPFFVLLLLALGPAIYCEDKGPVFYNSPRLGRRGKVFNMYKLRTMKINAPDIRNKDGSTFSSEDDPRLTRIGRFIRKTSLDEVPQIFNVIKGDMSLIGPRPDLPEFVDNYTDIQRKKLLVRPGITGYNQAYYRNSNNLDDRFKNDVFYSENISFVFDLKIFIKTIRIIAKSENVYRNS